MINKKLLLKSIVTAGSIFAVSLNSAEAGTESKTEEEPVSETQPAALSPVIINVMATGEVKLTKKITI